jgi:phage terminase large subunit-like protein
MVTANAWPPAWLTPVPELAIESGKGESVIDFAEIFGIITKDSIAGSAGSQLVLREWQKDLLRHVFARGDDGGLRHRINLIGMPRKQGKSAVASTLGVYSLFGSGIKGAEVYSCAADRDQARIVFADAKRMVEASPDLMSMAKLYRDAIEIPEFNSVYRVLSSEAFTKEGLSPTAVIFDELHAQPNRELFDVMSLAQGARGSMATLIAITTAGVKTDNTGKDSICYSLYQYGQKVARGEIDDPSFFMAWWEAPQEADHRLQETWEIANPGLGDICALSDFESSVRRTPEAEFRTKRCNQWVSSQLSWLPTGTWDACETVREIDTDAEYVLGFDGSFNGDTTVIVGCRIPTDDEDKPHLFLVKAWEKPLDSDDSWRVDIQDAENAILDFCSRYKVREVACDPFRWQRSMEVLQDAGVPIVEWPSTSARRMVVGCAAFYDAVLEERITHDGDPLLARHLDNAVVKIDNLGPRIVKENRGSNRRIDAAVAAVIAYDRSGSRIETAVVPGFYI